MKTSPTTLLFAALAMLLMAACGTTLTDDTHTFDGQKWMRFEPEKYQFDVKNIDPCYDILLTLRIDTTVFTANELPIIIDMFAPNGEHRMFSTTLRVHDAKGHLNGTRMGQYVDVSVPAKQWFYFNAAGTQRMEVKQATSHYDLDGISSLTLTVKKSDMRLKEQQ